MANLLLPAHHPLESWRDTAPRAGIRGLGQPVMQPVFDSKPLGDILLSAAAKSVASAKLPWTTPPRPSRPNGSRWLPGRNQTSERVSGTRSDAKAVVRGAAARVGAQARHLAFKAPVPTRPRWNCPCTPIRTFFFTTVAAPTSRGCRRLPEPVTQLVWDSWAEIHPETARKLGVATDDIIEIKTRSRKAIEAPVLVESTVASRRDRGAARAGAHARTAAMQNRRRQCVVRFWRLGCDLRGRHRARDRATRKLVSPLGKSDMMGRSIVEAMSIEQLASGIVPKSEAEEVTARSRCTAVEYARGSTSGA